jgi:hypothetical protein
MPLLDRPWSSVFIRTSSLACRQQKMSTMPSSDRLWTHCDDSFLFIRNHLPCPAGCRSARARFSLDCMAVLLSSWWIEAHDGKAVLSSLGVNCFVTTCPCRQHFTIRFLGHTERMNRIMERFCYTLSIPHTQPGYLSHPGRNSHSNLCIPRDNKGNSCTADFWLALPFQH